MFLPFWLPFYSLEWYDPDRYHSPTLWIGIQEDI
jgi:hypothetical protein